MTMILEMNLLCHEIRTLIVPIRVTFANAEREGEKVHLSVSCLSCTGTLTRGISLLLDMCVLYCIMTPGKRINRALYLQTLLYVASRRSTQDTR